MYVMSSLLCMCLCAVNRLCVVLIDHVYASVCLCTMFVCVFGDASETVNAAWLSFLCDLRWKIYFLSLFS